MLCSWQNHLFFPFSSYPNYKPWPCWLLWQQTDLKESQGLLQENQESLLQLINSFPMPELHSAHSSIILASSHRHTLLVRGIEALQYRVPASKNLVSSEPMESFFIVLCCFLNLPFLELYSKEVESVAGVAPTLNILLILSFCSSCEMTE